MDGAALAREKRLPRQRAAEDAATFQAGITWPLEPMSARLASAVPSDDEHWAFEMKWDGIRLLARIEEGRVQLMTRNRIDATPRYPELLGLGNAAGGHNVILDGEVVGFDEAGRHTFEALQQRTALEGGRRVAFMAF